MAKKGNGLTITIATLLLGTLAVVVPIGWDWWTSERGISLTRLNQVSLLERKANIDGLRVLYKDSEIKNLSRMALILKNTGRVPISNDDVISKPTVSVSGGQILGANIEKTRPENINSSLDTTGNDVILGFDLLNPGDSIEFSILVDSVEPNFTASARIKDVKALSVSTLNEEDRVRRKLTWDDYLAGFVSLLFIALGIGFIRNKLRQRHFMKKFGDDREDYFPIQTSGDAAVLIEREMRFLTTVNRDALIKKLPDKRGNLSAEETELVYESVNKAAEAESPGCSAIFVFAISAAGLWHILKPYLT